MRDAVMGVLIGAAAVVVAAWYLSRTRGQLLPGDVFGLGLGAASSSDACGCGPAPNPGYLAAPTRGSGQPPLVLGGSFQ